MSIQSRMADLSLSDDIVFDGSGGTDKFIRAVRKAAFNVGKHNDDTWCAGFASTCLEGSAFAFYEQLGEEAQNSWKLLRNKLVDRFPLGTSESQSVNEPTPAAAGPTKVDRRSDDASSLEHSIPVRTNDGFIRVIDTAFITVGYVSLQRHENGHSLGVDRNLSTAVCVRLRKTNNPAFHELCTVARDGSSQQSFQLMFPDGDGTVGKGSTLSGCLDIRESEAAWLQSEIWMICQDGTLDCTWRNPDRSRWLLQSAVSLGDGELRLFPDFKAAGGTSQGFQRVRLVSERGF